MWRRFRKEFLDLKSYLCNCFFFILLVCVLLHLFFDVSQDTVIHPIYLFFLQMCLFDRDNFQGRCIEITNECMNVCDIGMDRVRSLRWDCGPRVSLSLCLSTHT